MYQLIIKNGRVLDPANGIDRVASVAVENGRIVGVNGFEGAEALQVVDATGCIVTPGLIDHHAHLYPLAAIGLPAEAVCFASGVTTAVDAGSTGCDTFGDYETFLGQSKLRIRAYLNVCSIGLASLPRCMEDVDPAHFDEEAIRETFDHFGDRLLGLKLRTSREIVGELGFAPLKATVALADKLGVPVMVHCTNPPGSIPELLSILRPGDVMTHMYMNKGQTLLDGGKTVCEAAYKARERGVLFEAADARAHFSFEVGEPAIREGFYPDIIATDLTKLSMNLRPTSFSMTMQISKYTALGIPFEKVIACATVNPARELGILDRAGSLTAGHAADVAVLRPVDMETVHGDRPYGAKEQHTFTGHRIYQAVLTLKSGEMVYRDMTF